jgi:hypothetical protein
LDGRLAGVRGLPTEVNNSIAVAEQAAAGVSESANRTLRAAQASSTEVVDHTFRRMLLLLLVGLVGVPAAMLSMRY